MSRLIAVMFIVFFVPSAIHANTYQTLDAYEVRAWSGNIFLVPIQPSAIDPEGCGSSAATSYLFGSTATSNRDLMKTIAVGGQMASRKLRVVLHGCENNRPLINGVWVTD